MTTASQTETPTLDALDTIDQRLAVALDARDTAQVASLALTRSELITHLVEGHRNIPAPTERLQGLLSRHVQLETRIQTLLGSAGEDLGRVRRHQQATEKYHRMTTLESR